MRILQIIVLINVKVGVTKMKLLIRIIAMIVLVK